MKATLTFNLPEEQEEFKDAQRGTEYHGVLQEIDNFLRNRLKYEELTSEVSDALQGVRDELHRLVDPWE